MNEFTTRISSYVSPLLKHHYAITKTLTLTNNPNVHSRRCSSGTSSSASLNNALNINHGANSPFLRNVKIDLCKKPDLYEVLGLSKTCSQFDIRNAYKKLCKKYHPDHNPDGQERFETISEAYQVLGDPYLRKLYDQQTTCRIPSMATTPPTFEQSTSPTNSVVNNKEGDIQHIVNCTLEDLYNGNTKKRFKIKRKILCDKCTTSQSSKCSACNGKSTISQHRIIKLSLKRGMKSGQSIIFPGDGDQYSYNRYGDLVFTLQQQPHESFARIGDHLLTQHDITNKDSSGYFKIRHLDGRVLRIQHKNNNPTIKCVDNEGMPHFEDESRRGHLYISLAKIGSSNFVENIDHLSHSFTDVRIRDVTQNELTSLNIPKNYINSK
jgi:DnaJ-class molecular chaperone